VDDAFLDASIERHRKDNFVVALPDVAPGTAVKYRLKRHQFEFGTAISATMIGLPRWKDGKIQPPARASDINEYSRVLSSYYNAAVAENEHKWYAMETSTGFQLASQALALWEWCAERDITMRGHAIYWGVPRWQPEWMKQIPAAQLEARMKRRLHHALHTFEGKISEWDLNNELLEKDIFGEQLGFTSGTPYFRWAKAAAPDVRFYVNEWRGLQTGSVDRYVAMIRQMQAEGAAIGGIGDQAHYHDPVQSNEAVWAMLDKLGQFGLPVKITEFDLAYKDMSEAAQAADLRRFYRLCFAHPSVEGVYQWGFWEGAHWRTAAALWRQDWTPKPAAQAYMDLMTREWVTAGEAPVGADGQLRFRGFHGDYELDWGTAKQTVSLTRRPRPAALPQIQANPGQTTTIRRRMITAAST
jgi:GH35 family endo-1,4-beta-xylanase